MILATLCYIKQNGHTLMVYRDKKPNDMHEGKDLDDLDGLEALAKTVL
jgi:hypothetical protein